MLSLNRSERSLNQMSLNRHSLQCKPYGNQTKVQKCVLKSEMSLNQTSLNRTLPVIKIQNFLSLYRKCPYIECPYIGILYNVNLWETN